MVDSTISAGQTQIPYQEITYSLSAGQVMPIFQVFNYFRVLSIDVSGLLVQFGQNGLITPFSGQGLGLQLAYTYDRVTLINNSGGVMNITIALALGQVNDDRLNVSSSLTIGSVIPGTGATNLGKAEDAPHTSGDTGVFMLAVRNDFLTNSFGSNGDYTPLATDYKGSLIVKAANRVIATGQFSIGTTAVQILALAQQTGEITISAGIADLYIGNSSGVTTANGFLIPANSSLSLNGNMGDIYGIRGVAAQTAYLLNGVN